MNSYALKRPFTLMLQTVGILCLSLLNPGASASAYQSNDDRTVILRLITQIAGEFSKAERQEKSAIESAAEEKVTAEANQQKRRAGLAAAQSQLGKREDAFKELREKYDSMRQNKAGKNELEAAAKEVETAGTERDKARETLYYFERDESSYSLRATEADAKLQELTSAFANNTVHRAGLKAELEQLSKQWQADPSAENLMALSDRVAAISCEQNIFANPFWNTRPNHGANLYYQSIGERNRGGPITPITNPTQTQQPICLGIYYVWAVRNGKVTSNKDKTIVVFLGLPEVTIVEDR